MKKRNLVLMLLLASAFSSHAMAGDLHDAVAEGDAVRVQELLAAGHNPNEQNHRQDTPLQIAVLLDGVEILNILLEHKDIDLNKKDFWGLTPFYTAVKCDRVESIKRLLEHPDIDPNQTNNDGWTPLSFAIHKNSVESIRTLLEHPDTDPNQPNNQGQTPLSFAIHKNSVESIRTLLQHPDIDPNQPNNQGQTPLHTAVVLSNVEIVKILLTHPKTNIHSKDLDGFTPINMASNETNNSNKPVLQTATVVALLCGINETAPAHPEELFEGNFDRFISCEELLFSYDIKDLEHVHTNFSPLPPGKKIKKILAEAIEYKKKIAEEEEERLSFVTALSSAEDSPLPTWTRVAVGGTTAVGGATGISMPSCFLNFAQAETAVGHAHSAGTEGNAETEGNAGTDDEEEGEVVDGEK